MGQRSRGAVSSRWLSTVWMVVVVLSLVLMHGLALSHTGTTQCVTVPTVAAASLAPDVATGGGHSELTGSAAGHSGHHEPGAGHSGALTQACLAVLTALVLMATFFALKRKGWTRFGHRRRMLVTPHLWDPVRWWVHPRIHVLCVMRT
ncbi:hypothetical protein K0651_13200 [Ornithinimicrobium sp. Arc0846-15]|nr:hypothetical protein [Ornithinimicrobium laminariae]